MALISILRHGRAKASQLARYAIVRVLYDEYTIARYFRKQGAQIGNDCRLLVRSLGDEPYLVKLGNHVTVAGGVTFVTHDGAAWIARQQIPDIQIFGPIIIEDNCVIGQSAILLPNIHIGENSIVGAGSTVISDVPANTVVMGVPARPIGSTGKYVEKCVERWAKQRPPDMILEAGKDWWHSKHYAKNRERLREHLTHLFWGDGDSDKRSGEGDRE